MLEEEKIIGEIIAFTGGKAYTGTALTWREAGGFRITKCHEARIYLDRLTVDEARKLYEFLENRYNNCYHEIYGVEGHDSDEFRKDYLERGGLCYDLVSLGLIDNTKFPPSLCDFKEGEMYYIIENYHYDSWRQFFEEGLNRSIDDQEDMEEEDIEFYSGAYKSAVEYFSAHENDVQGRKIFVVIEKWGDDYDRFHFAVLAEESTYTELAGEKYRLFIDIDRLLRI